MKFTPDQQKYFRFFFFSIIFLSIFSAFQTSVLAERLPLKLYSSADGLANDGINHIVSDSRGFLWFCTGEGLSRFDGFRFKNYTQEQGLPHRNISDFLETKDGDYLVGTSGGLAVFNPLGKAFRWDFIAGKLEQNSEEPPMFKTYLTPESEKDSKISKSIVTLGMDSNGTVFVGTTHGLFKFVKTNGDWHFEKIEIEEWKDRPVVTNSLFLDSRKNLWIASSFAIYLMGTDGVIRKVNEAGGNSIFEDQSGKIWADSGGNDIGARVYEYQNTDLTPTLIRTYGKKDGLAKNGFTNAVAQTPDGKLLIVSDGKLFEFIPNAKENESKFRPIESELISNVASKDGTIWFSIANKGVARYLPNNFYTFGEKDGLPQEIIRGIFGNKDGEVFLTSGKKKLARVSDGKIEVVELSQVVDKGWIDSFLDLQSQNGEFWISSTNGLLRFPKVPNFNDLARVAPQKVYTKSDGLFNDGIVAIFEDSRGDIWISSPTAENSLMRWEKSTEKIYPYTFADGLPKGSGATAFGEDSSGNIWIRFYFGQIVRYKDRKFRDFTEEGLIQRNSVTEFLSDKQGRFWLSTASRGLFRIDDPNSEQPAFTNFSTADGLSSNQALCLGEDNFGRIYVGTGRGINRIEPDLKRVKNFTQNDGLPGNVITACYTDVKGNLWFSSSNSLIKYSPQIEKASAPPPIFIDRISVNGKLQSVSELGEKEIKNLEFASDERQIQISFLAISFDAGETLPLALSPNRPRTTHSAPFR